MNSTLPVNSIHSILDTHIVETVKKILPVVGIKEISYDEFESYVSTIFRDRLESLLNSGCSYIGDMIDIFAFDYDTFYQFIQKNPKYHIEDDSYYDFSVIEDKLNKEHDTDKIKIKYCVNLIYYVPNFNDNPRSHNKDFYLISY